MSYVEKDPISLITELAKIYTRMLKEEMRRGDFRIAYHHLLKPLYEKDNVTQLDLVKSSDLKAPTVSYSLQLMESEGLIYRETDENDARSTRVHLTDEGREVERQIQIMEKNIFNIFLKDVGKENQEMLVKLLSQLNENAQKYLENPRHKRKIIISAMNQT